jgi:hypothetical protein
MFLLDYFLVYLGLAKSLMLITWLTIESCIFVETSIKTIVCKNLIKQTL